LNQFLYEAVLAGNIFFVQQLLRLGAQLKRVTTVYIWHPNKVISLLLNI